MARGKAIDKKKLASLWSLSGVPTKAVAHILGTTPGVVRQAAKRLNLPDRPEIALGRDRQKNEVPDADELLLKSLWGQGARVVDIARVLGCSPGHITRLVKRSGLPRRRGAYTPRASQK